MKLEERDDFIDLLAQAVIDRIEERDRVSSLVNLVVSRVIEMQKEESLSKTPPGGNNLKEVHNEDGQKSL